MKWEIIEQKIPDLKDSILITGLPGIANVGKIVVDFLIEELKAKKIAEFYSHYMPNSVFVKENNLVELPKIKLYFAKKQKLLILSGDAQPIDEPSTYLFCETLLDFFQKHKAKEIITLGGIGLRGLPKTPKVYITGNHKEIVKKYNSTKIIEKIHGVVGPIMGVSGLLLGLANKRKIKAVSLLAETLGHPMYLGLKGSKEILKILDKKLSLNVNLKNLEKEIKEYENSMKLSQELKPSKKTDDVNYIG